MNESIQKALNTAISTQKVSREELYELQKLVDSAQDCVAVYYLMGKYYDLRHREDASVYCCLKAKDILENNKMDMDLRMSQFISDKTDFMHGKLMTLNNRIFAIAITLGVFTMISMWAFLHQSFVLSFIFMNIFSVAFYTMAVKRTNAKFKARQLAACYDFLDEEDKKFGDKY